MRRALGGRLFVVLFCLVLSLPSLAASVIVRAPAALPNHYIVSLRGTPPADVPKLAATLAKQYDGKLLTTWHRAVQGFWIEMTPENAARLALDARIAAIEEDALVYQSGSGVQTTGPGSVKPVIEYPSTDPLWHLTRISRRLPESQQASSQLPNFFRYEYGSDGQLASGARVRVYIIDEGTTRYHQEFYRTEKSVDDILSEKTRNDPTNEDVLVEVDGSNRVSQRIPQTKSGTVPAGLIPAEDTSPSTLTCNGGPHASAVASLVVGRQVGVAKGVEVVPVKVIGCSGAPEQATSTAALISAFEWILEPQQNHRPAVVSLSTFRATTADFSDLPKNARPCSPTKCIAGNDLLVLEQAVNAVIDAGIPVVAAANNQNDDACKTVPARLSRRGGRTYVDNGVTLKSRVITVGGTTINDTRWIGPSLTPSEIDNGGTEPKFLERGSNYGQCVDIWAPATALTLADPAAPNRYRVAANANGTSFSAPIVAGTIARLLSEDPWLSAVPRETADRVWNRLAAGATRLNPATLGVASPNLLVYAGGIPIKDQPESKTISSGASVTLTVMPLETDGIEYEWYKGTAGDASGNVRGTAASYTFTATTETAGSYWVRVGKRTGTVWERVTDSNAATVTVADCSPPKVTAVPESKWVTLQNSSETTRLGTTVEPGSYDFKWVRIAPNGSETVVLQSTASNGSSPVEIGLNVTMTGSGVQYFRVEIWPDEKPACTYRSDTVQVRACKVPQITRELADGASEYVWDLASGPLGQSLGITATDDSTEGEKGLLYQWYIGRNPSRPYRARNDPNEQLVTVPTLLTAPTATDYFSVRVANGCGQVFSKELKVILCDTYLSLGIDREPDRSPIAPRYEVPAERDVLLKVQSYFGIMPNPRAVTYRWRIGDGPWSGGQTLTVRLPLGSTFVEVEATDPVTSCVRRHNIELVAVRTPFKVLSGLCSLSDQPVVISVPGYKVELEPTLVDDQGRVIRDSPSAGWIYEWTDGTETHSGRSWIRTIPGTGSKPVNLTVRSALSPHSASVVIQLQSNGSQPCDDDIQTTPGPCKTITQCKRHASGNSRIKVSGEPTSSIVVTAGQSLALSPPETSSDYTYAWFRETADGTTQFSDDDDITETPSTSTTYWVITETGEGPVESDPLYVTVPEPAEVAIVPLYQMIEASSIAYITTPFEPDETTKFEWRIGNNQNSSSAIIGNQQTLAIANLADDTTFWLLIKHGPGNPQQEYRSNYATVAVACTPTINGVVSVTPPSARFGRNDAPLLTVAGYGKLLRYTWERHSTLSGPRTPAGSGEGIMPVLTTPVTYFSVTMTDSCGTSTTLAPVPVYLCIPTIAVQPRNEWVTPNGSTTLRALGDPAVTGQTLTYRWFRKDPNGDVQVGEDEELIVTLPPGVTQQSYYALVYSSCASANDNSVISATATVTLCTPPVIQNITSREIAPGQTGVVSVTATGSNLTYQWYRGQSGDTAQPIEGETFAALSASPSVTTDYWCRVTSDNSCSTDSDTTQITVCTNPVITQPVEDVTIGPNSGAEIYVAATGATGYQWYDADTGLPITGATSDYYVTPELTQDARYFARVFNGECHVDSDTITVYVCELSATVSTNKTRIVTGESALITASVTFPRSQELYYTWYSGPTEAANTIDTQGPGISSILRSPSVTTWYRVMVSDGTCVAYSATVKVEYCVSPTVNVHPVSQLLDKTQNPNATKELVAGATGGSVTWQWYIGESGNVTTPVPGATSPSLIVSPSQDTWYWARATGTCGYFDDSDAAKITICQPTAITTQPTVRVVTANTPTVMQVFASGTNLSYQWYKGPAGNTSTPIGENAPAIWVTVATTTEFWVRITGACGTINSTAGLISVAPAVAPLTEKRVTKGTSATFTVSASGTYLSYQWYYSPSVVIPGATSATFTTPPLQSSTAVWVRVQSGQASTDTTPVNVIVCQAKPISVGQPSNVSGSSVTLSVVGPDPNESYSWYRGDSGNTAVYLGDGTSKMVNPDVTTNYWFRSAGYGCHADSTTVTVAVCVPRITAQPTGGMIDPNGTMRLSVAAAGTPTLTYQWYGNGVAINGATLSYYDAAPQNDTAYFVRVKSSQGASCWVDSNSVTVSVCKPPSISAQPQTINPPAYSTVNLGVTANGTDLTYQWYEQTSSGTNVAISGAISNIYSVYATSTRKYWVRVSGRCGTTDSQIAWVSIPPALPATYNVFVQSGSSATFTVNASGNHLTYQWYQGSTPQPNGTGATFTTPALTNDTSFWVRVWSGQAWVDSGYYDARVCKSRAVNVNQPSNVSGSPVTLSVATPAADESYTWYDAVGNAINSGTQITVSPAGTTSYLLRTTRGTCSADTVVPVTVCVPRINTQPAGTMVNPGQTATVSVSAQGSGPLAYQWYSGATPLSGGSGPSYSFVPNYDTTVWVRVWSTQGGSCYVDSAIVNVQVCEAPVITSSTPNESIHDVMSVLLSVQATGTDLTYQWYENTTGTNVAISGATSSTFSIQPGSTRSFWVRVSGRCGYADSATTLISVYPKISAQPTDRSVCSGAPTTFTIGATGSSLVYRWYAGPSGTKTTFLGSGHQLPIASVTGNTTVWCEVSSGNAAVNSQAATVSVQPGPAASISKWWGGYSFYLTANVHPDDGPYVGFAWYRGPMGNTSQPAGGGPTISVYEETQTTYWVRVTDTRTGCWTDRSINVPY